MAAEFKIGRLRFTWRGEWVTNNFYNRDAVVQYEGKCYVCKEPHTSSSTDFYDDLYYVTGGGADQPRWGLMLDGRAWKEEWTPNTAYSLGNIVKYGGVVYVCTEAHTSGPQQIDQTKWTTYFQFDNWNNAWTTSTVYGEGDIVKYGGIVYRCIVDHESTTQTSAGLEADQSKWEIVNSGIEYRGEWTATTRYKLNDVVKNGADAYICTAGHTSATSFDDTKFDLWMPGAEFYNGWNSSAVYQPGDIVIYGGYSYVSLIINNTNIIPSTNSLDSSSAWQLVTKGFNTRNDWSSGSYKVGDVVRRGGQLFVAISDNSGQDPTAFSVSKTYTAAGSSGTTVKVNSSTGIVPGMIIIGDGFTLGQTVVYVQNSTTVVLDRSPDGTVTDNQILNFVGVNYTYWSLVVPSVAWTSFWEAEILYTVGEIVVWQNATYRCIQTISNTTSATRPDLDVANAYWTPLALHDRFNAGNTQGDIVTRNDSDTNVALPIGLEDQVLRSTSGQPQWRKIQSLPDVYYVTPDGVDDPTRGDTIDKPWGSIKYACEYIAAGTLFQNTNFLLTENKDFLVEEMYQWMVYQKDNNIAPFTSASVFDEFSTRRDAKLVIDALSYDITRGSNSRIIFATEAYFAEGSDTTFKTTETDDAQDYIVASLTYLLELIGNVIQNDEPTADYQALNNVLEIDRVPQVIDNSKSAEIDSFLEIESLMTLLIDAVENADKSSLPLPNYGITATIMVKTGTYSEELPIVIPDNVALNGDELRGAVVQPKLVVYTSATASSSSTNEITIDDTSNMVVDIPIQFNPPTSNDDFSNITFGQTYYIKSIDDDKITISETVGGPEFTLTDGTGFLTVYAGDCLKDMFYVRNATGIRNMTLTGLAGFLGPLNQYATRRPTGGAYVSLDPGEGPDDTRTWILRRSPYIQNVTNFGVGCTGLKIDGTLHNGGNKSIVCNDFTQILSDGIGVWCTGPGSLTECVSVFGYYNYAGYFAEDGGRIRATNGNSSYGSYGVIAEGFDDTEVPISGLVDNRSTQVQADVQSAFGTAAELLSMQYNNAGSGYFETTTNLLEYSNGFITGWTTDGNVTIQQNNTAPNGESTAWTLTGTTSSSDSSYIYQDVIIPPAGKEYTGLSSLNVTGSGSSATFDIIVGATAYTAIVNAGGSGYVVGNQLRVLGSQLGGVDGTNDCFLEVQSLSGSSILTVTVTGTVPTGSNQKYTLSIYAKEGTSASFDMSAIFSGDTTCTANANFNFASETFTTFVSGGSGTVTTGKLELPNGWWRIWITVYDYNALNDAVQFRIYPRSRTGNSGYTRFYGAQLQIADNPTFYLETTTNKHTSYADFYVTGAGTGAELVGDELRGGSVFQTRITDEGTGAGGRGYVVGSNNAQAGDETQITLAGSDTRTENEYVRMRVFLQSGTGAGQYGYISSYDDTVSKVAQVLRESFIPLNIESTDATLDELTLSSGTTDTLYVDQEVQFIPTYYTTEVLQTSTESLDVESTTGGTSNFITVLSTAKLSVNMTVKFSGNMFGGLTSDYFYYIKEVINGTQFSITTEPFGNVQQLVTAASSPTQIMRVLFPSYTNRIEANTDNMLTNMPISFTGTAIGGIEVGTTYYVNDVIDASTFTISTTLVELNVTATQASTNYLTTSATSNLVSMNPIIFSGTTIGGPVAGTKYYINKLINATQFTITDTIIETEATATEAVTNLITVGSTTGFIANNPIKFIGDTFGGIVNGTIYYILAINDATTFTISTSPGGSAVTLSDGTGRVYVETTDAPFALTTASGTMSFATTNTRETLDFGQGSMNGTYSTKLFGNVVKGTSYYISTITSDTTFTISDTLGGSTFALKTDVGSMNLGAVGWDHINPGTPIETVLDNSTVYYVEPRVEYDTPTFTQSASTLPTLALGSAWSAIGYGDGTFIALPDSYATAARSTNGTSWTAVTLPETTQWADIAYGNNYWVTISEEVELSGAPNVVAYSNSDGIGWRTSSMPASTSWKKLRYGNGKFVSIANSSVFTFADLPATTITGTGTGARFNVTITGGVYTAVVLDGGTGFSVSNTLKILGTTLGGATPANDLTLTVSALASGPFVPDPTAIGSVTLSGTAVTSSASAYSTDYGITWNIGNNLPQGAYTGLTYGAGRFVAVAEGKTFYNLATTNVTGTGSGLRVNITVTGDSYSVGITTSGTGYSNGQTVKVLGTSLGGATTVNDVTLTITSMDGSPGGDPTAPASLSAAGTAVSNYAAYSTDGITWTASILPTTATWSDVAFGNGLFVAVSSTDSKTAYSRDGITWLSSDIVYGPMSKVAYGQGVFVAVDALSGTAYTTEDGKNWATRTVSDDGYSAIGFGFASTTGDGRFVTAAGQSTGSYINAGCQTKGRVNIASGRITSINLWEPGSGYTSAPDVTITDPNITLSATTSNRISNGTLGNPSFINRGQDYNTNSTHITITGGGYADTFQTGLTIIVKDLTSLPAPGDNLVIAGVDQVYKVTSATAVFGTTAPNIQANIQTSPEMSVANSPSHESAVTIRTKYSQARLTGHDFLNVGYGNAIQSNYPDVPEDTVLAPQDQAVEVNFGRVFYTSTDQDGNFRVGNLFAVEQATGIVTLSASQFGLSGLETLSLGGIAVGTASVVIRQFSTDETFIANSNEIIPTQRAIKSYLTNRLSQGGSNTFTGQLIAGTVLVGGPNKISSTIPDGYEGAVVNMPNIVRVQGEFAGWDGDGMALQYFIKSANRR